MHKISELEFQEWRNSYATEFFFDYLLSRADDVGEGIKKDFYGGALPYNDMSSMTYQAGQARAFQEIGDITYKDIEGHYEEEIESDTDEGTGVSGE